MTRRDAIDHRPIRRSATRQALLDAAAELDQAPDTVTTHRQIAEWLRSRAT